MIFPQSPTLPVFIPTQAVLSANMPAQRFSPVATIQANHIVLLYGTSHGHGRSTKLFWMICLPKLTDRPLYCRDEICKLTGPYSLMPYIAPDYFRREMSIDL